MSDEDEPEIVAKVYYEALTTRTLYRLTPTAIADPTRSSRQVAIVAAANEADARIMAKKADPFAQDWTDEWLFASDTHDTGEDHVIGDVTFNSTPAKPPVGKAAKRKSSTG